MNNSIPNPEKIRHPTTIGEVVQASTLSKLANEVSIDPSVFHKWKEMVREDSLVILGAMINSRFVGRVNVWFAPADELEIRTQFPGIPLINALQINTDARRRGVATSLLKAAEEVVKRNGIAQIGLGVEPSNIEARNLYEKLGYSYQKIGAAETYESCWDETLSDGSIKHVCVPTLFMIKDLEKSL